MGAPEPPAASDIQLLTRTYIQQYATTRRLDGLQLLPLRLDRDAVVTVFGTIDRIVDSRRDHFWHMCEELNITLANVHNVYNSVVVNVFRDGTSWSRILTAVAFTYVLSQYCRSVGLDGVADVLPERLSMILSQPPMSGWIRANGSVAGLRDFAETYENNVQQLEGSSSAHFTAVTGFLAKGLNFSIKIVLGSNNVC